VTPAQMTGRTMKGSGAVRLVNHSAPSYVIDGSCRAGGGTRQQCWQVCGEFLLHHHELGRKHLTLKETNCLLMRVCVFSMCCILWFTSRNSSPR
jgi:hypothetical protein